MNGGERLARILQAHGVDFLFTLCGGHISPLLVECKRRGIRVVDVRNEASAVFAADAVARLTGKPGAAAVTAGPGVTNATTAVMNAKMAQSPLVLLGGATATVLKGRGSLQDIEQLPLMASITKKAAAARRVGELEGLLLEALRLARSGVPGPTFLECPVDLLYPEATVREWYAREGGDSPLVSMALKLHLDRQFAAAPSTDSVQPLPVDPMDPRPADLRKALRRLVRASRPVLVVGSQVLTHAAEAAAIAAAVEALGIPTFLGGTSRGLLGRGHPLQFRHQRRQALREADLVLVAGFPFDFRLGYGRHLGRHSTVIAVNRSRRELRRNRRPSLGVNADPGRFLQALAGEAQPRRDWLSWFSVLRERERARDTEIRSQAAVPAGGFINPLALCLKLEEFMAQESAIVVDGGDFVATASYVVWPRAPLRWLDPGVFGTLGVGGGFALGAGLVYPDAEIWILYGDGSCAYSLAEFDTFVRHRVPVIALVGTDASWAQIAREQTEALGDPVGTELRRTDYHRVAEGYGGAGLLLEREEDIEEVFSQARRLFREGRPVLINAQIGTVDFRKGSISL
ncbi:MAG: thiamine pyrophosphate-binding protein [Armatimonadetes bacterium]|nr:thiamine pyrophosphate-binding protein [Armatimonadota bacterium]